MTMDYSTTMRLAAELVCLIERANTSQASVPADRRAPSWVLEDAAAVYGCVRTIDAITGHPWQLLSEVAHRIVAAGGPGESVVHNMARLITDGPSAWLLNEQNPPW